MLFSMSGCSRMLGTSTSSVRGIDLFFDAQLVGAEAHHFDVEIIVGEFELFAQGNVGVVVLEQGAEDVGELDDHLARQLGLAAHQRGHGVERVEEKVGIDLALQGVEAGFEQQALLLFERHLRCAARSTP